MALELTRRDPIMESLFFCIKINQIKYVIMSLILC